MSTSATRSPRPRRVSATSAATALLLGAVSEEKPAKTAAEREEMFTRLGLLIEHASTRPDCVERARQIADLQADDALYTLCHYLAELLTEIRAGTYQGPEWSTYQAPPRTRPAGTAPDLALLADLGGHIATV